LSLSFNEIGLPGFNELALLLEVNTCLGFVNFYFNNGGDEAGTVIAKSLRKNVTVVDCRLAENESEINELTQRNMTIQCRLISVWSRVSVLISFCRGNFFSTFRDSILQLVNEIIKFIGQPSQQLCWSRV